MKKIPISYLLIFLVGFIALSSFMSKLYAQNGRDSLIIDNCNYSPKRVIYFQPTKAPKSYGIGFGFFGSEIYCNLKCRRDSYGLGIQLIGQGLFQSFMINSFSFEKFVDQTTQKRTTKTRHNGILISTFGTYTEKINGVSISAWMSGGNEVNGLSFNLLWSIYQKSNGAVIATVNHVNTGRGLQVGLINKANNFRGIQIGLWNRNDKRSLPLINWSF
jgi:hypothetical protein